MDDITLLETTPTKTIDGELHTAPNHEIWVRNNEDIHKLVRNVIDRMNGKDGWHSVDLACIGAACVNEAIKAVAIVREQVRDKHSTEVYSVPFFSTITDDKNRRRTRIMVRLIPVVENLCAS